MFFTVLSAIDFLKEGGPFRTVMWLNVWVDGAREGNKPRIAGDFEIRIDNGFDIHFEYLGPDDIDLRCDVSGVWEWALWTRPEGGPPVAIEAPTGWGRFGQPKALRMGGYPDEMIRLSPRPLAAAKA